MTRPQKPRPIVRQRKGVLSWPRLPNTKPLVPGLRRGEPTDVMGFLDAGLISQAEAERELRRSNLWHEKFSGSIK